MCNNIDLNNVYDGSQVCLGNPERSPATLHAGIGSITCPLWVKSDFHKKSPLQMSRNSDSTSSLSPVPVERHRILDASTDSFWRSGWVYARMWHCVSFIYNGQVVLDTPLPPESHRNCKILSVKPIAVTLSERTHFIVNGFNIFGPTTRLLCALGGKFLIQKNCIDLVDGADTINEHDKLQSLVFPCSIPNITGRGFIEVEDHGLSSSFFPFIVSDRDICSEICMLEEAIEVSETADKMPKNGVRIEAKDQALDFIHEWVGFYIETSRSLGWVTWIPTQVTSLLNGTRGFSNSPWIMIGALW